MEHSPFVAILRLGCKYTSNAPQQQFRGLLHSLASTSYLFQAETTASPLDALLESLSTVGDNENLEAILSLLDEAVARCIRGPFKYLDEYAKAVVEIQKQNPEASGLPPVSPIIMTLAEQWKFFMESLNYSNEQKVCAVKWLLRFLESCVLLGENRYVLLALIVRLTADSGSIPEGFIDLKNCMQKDQSLELASKAMHDGTSRVGIRDLFVALPKPGIDLHIVPVLSKGILNNAIETSVFDLAVVQRAITGIVRSEKIVSADATAAVVKLNELMKYIASQLISQGGKVMENTKRFISKESSCLELFCSTSSFIGRILMIVEVSRGLWTLSILPSTDSSSYRIIGYAELLSTIFEKNNPILETAKERLSSFMLKFINVFQTLPDDDVPTVNPPV